MATRRKGFSAAVLKIVAARQQWRCSKCGALLPAAFEVDHTVPLWEGGGDDPDSNATAMCPNCHAAKTQHEAVQRAQQRARQRATTGDEYDNRTDNHNSDGVTVTCARCGNTRDAGTGHPVCPAIEGLGGFVRGLERFRFGAV